ncbi:MAG TPA: aminopeptidase P family protein [Ktedonobacteraceae bacterium]|jgi:Xaa-Pro aminopeptidase|nr:aminopeptidase P family protein [Ktedonobacteraceae bacterium]
MSQENINRLRTWLSEQRLDAFLVTQPQNRSYLSGWLNDDVEGAGMLLVGQQHQVLLTNPLYKEVAEREATGWEIVIPPSREYAPALARLAKEYGWSGIGFEAMAIIYGVYETIRAAGEEVFTLHPFNESIVSTLRLVKQPHELELLRQAGAITDQTFAHICQWIQPGMTEKEVQLEVANSMISLGADGPAFETIVASGPNGSMPHAHASQRRIQRGELITIDMGARYKGYCADMTRTICLGEPAEKRMVEVYDAVLNAMNTCEAGLHAGMKSQAADALARSALEMQGLAEYYIHSTGHGVGLQVHEGPSLSQRAPEDMTLPAGSVVTVEPGVYIPDWGGVRVEDFGLITEDGFESFSHSPTQLVIER